MDWTLLGTPAEWVRVALELGLRLSLGDGRWPDLGRGVEYFKVSAFLSDADGQFASGTCLSEGRGVSRNIIEAARYLKISAHQDDARGQTDY
jgi:TPR repeat protein